MTDTSTARTVVSFEDAKNLAGTELGETAWREITQEMINTFAEATDDHQWIHTDPKRAAEGPFGATIAHGFLTLSLIIPFWGELFDVEDVGTKLNYGLEKVRFTAPVPVGSKVRMHGTISDVQEVKGGGLHLEVDTSFEVEGQERPAAVATFLARFYP